MYKNLLAVSEFIKDHKLHHLASAVGSLWNSFSAGLQRMCVTWPVFVKICTAVENSPWPAQFCYRWRRHWHRKHCGKKEQHLPQDACLCVPHSSDNKSFTAAKSGRLVCQTWSHRFDCYRVILWCSNQVPEDEVNIVLHTKTRLFLERRCQR